jgi:hypothetical protein
VARADLEVSDEQIESILLACMCVAGIILLTLIFTR